VIYDMKGFTLPEVIVTVVVLLILATIGIPQLRAFQNQATLETETGKVLQVLREARSAALGAEYGLQAGVYFDSASKEYAYFRGPSYAGRTAAYDVVHELPEVLVFSGISLGAGTEVVFAKVDGTAAPAGLVTLALASDLTKERNVHVEESGKIGTSAPGSPSDAGRLTDSRHAHVSYTRSIDTALEDLVLTFDGGTAVVTLPLSVNQKGGQIWWEGDADVGGEQQTIKIHTHELNGSSGSAFSINRDRMVNTKSLQVELSGDATGYIIFYDADGVLTDGTSIYAAAPELQ